MRWRHTAVVMKGLERREWVLALVAFLLAVGWQFITFNGFSNDHYVHVARARQMLLGAWPVRDFVDPGMPLTYGVSALARLIFGEAVRTEFIVVAMGIGIGAAATAVCAMRLAGSVIVACVVVLLEVLVSPRSYSYPKILLYSLAAGMLIAVAADGNRKRVLLAAVLTAVAFLVRHDHGLYIGAACALVIVCAAPSWSASARRFAIFSVVAGCLLLPWAIAVQWWAGLVPYFESGVAFARREADISVFRGFPKITFADGVNTAENAQSWLFYLVYALPVVSVVLAVWRHAAKRDRWPGEAAAIGGIALMALAVDRGFLRNPLSTRVADTAVPACLLGAWLLGLAWTTRPGRAALAGSLRLVATAILVVTTGAVWVVGDATSKLDEAGVFNRWEAVTEHVGEVVDSLNAQEIDAQHMPSRVSGDLVPFFRYVDRCTAPTDRLFVSGPYPEVYVVARRGFAGGHVAHLEDFYSSEAEQSLTLARMQRESVPFVLLVLDEQDNFTRSFPKMVAHIASAYEPLADLPVNGMMGVRVLVERGRKRSGVDAETGWPCFR